MYDIHEFEITGKGIAALVLVVFILLVVAGSVGYMLGLRHVSDHGSGTEPVGQQLNEAGTNISNATAGIEQAENHIATGTESVEYLQGTVSTSADIIANCKRILEAVRARGKTNASTH